MGTFSFPEDSPASAAPPSPPSPASDVEMIDVDDLDDPGSLPGTPTAAATAHAGETSKGYDQSLWWTYADEIGIHSGSSPPYNDGKVLDITWTNSENGRTYRWTPPRPAGKRRVSFGSPLVRGRISKPVPAKGILRGMPPTAAPERETGGMTGTITQSITSVFSALKGYLFPEPLPVRGTLIQSSTAAFDARPAKRKRGPVQLHANGYSQLLEHEYRQKRQKNSVAGYYTTATGSPGAPHTPEKTITTPEPTEAQMATPTPKPEDATMRAELTTGEDVHKARSSAGEDGTKARSAAREDATKARSPGEDATEARSSAAGEDANMARSKPHIDTGRKSYADEIRARKAFNEKASKTIAAAAARASMIQRRRSRLQLLTPPVSRPNTGDSSKAPTSDYTAIEVAQDSAHTQKTTRPSRQDIKDKQIDGLVLRTVKHKLAPTRLTAAQRQAAEDAAKQIQEAEQERIAQLAAEKLAADKLVAEEQERIARELAAQKLAAEKQAAEEQAALKAKNAQQHQIIRDVPTASFEVILGKLANTNPRKTIAEIGGCLISCTTIQRILASENGTNNWLDDEAVNGWFNALCAAKNAEAGWTKESGTAAPFACFNSAWFRTAKRSIKSIARWAKRQHAEGSKLLQCERLYIPINTSAHWQLLIINGKDRSIEFLCSMGDPGQPFFDLAHKFLAQELGSDYRAGEWTDLKRASNRSQSQSNTSDCGVFTCFNGLAAAQNISYKEVTSKRMPTARKHLAAVLLNGGFDGDYEL